MTSKLAGYLALTLWVMNMQPAVAMDSPPSAQAIPSSSGILIKEYIEDPIKWNSLLISLINEYFGKQYKDTSHSINKTISDIEITVPRPNHGLAHGMRQGLLAVNIVDGFEYVNPKDFTSSETADFIRWIQINLKKDPYFRHKIQLTAAFQRTGRESEADISHSFKLIQQYEYQDSENFYKAAKNFVGPDSLFNSEHEVILYKQAILKHSEFKDAVIKPDNKELQYLRRIILTSHTLDLRRLIKTEFNESTVLANATKSLFGPETAFSDPNFKNSFVYPQFRKEELFIKKLWEYSGRYLQDTGDRYDGKFEDSFFIQAKNPDQMVSALLKVYESLKSAPHPVGIFLYSACPVKFGKLQTKQPRTEAYEWCVLLTKNSDGSYEPLGSAATPFEDEAEVAHRGVREQSNGLYDISPASFDREIFTPHQEGETLEELKLRSLNRLKDETSEQRDMRLNAFTSQDQPHPRELSGSKGETLQELKARRAFSTLPSSVHAKEGEKISSTLFFKEVPFYAAKEMHGNEYAWVPVRHLINLQDNTVTFNADERFVTFFNQDREHEIVSQSVKLNLFQPFAQLLSQEDVKNYLKENILSKPLPVAMVNKMKAQIDLKKKISAKDDTLPAPVNADAFTMFDKYAQTQLGDNAKDTQSNLAQIIEQHNQQGNHMLQLLEKHPYNPADYVFYQITPDIGETLLKMVNMEKKQYPWFVFYHAVPAEIYQVYQICTEFKSLLAGKNLENNLLLRGLDDPFSLIQNIEDFYQKAHAEYAMGGAETMDKTSFFRKQGMSVNMTLFGGLQEAIASGSLSEYSIHRWMGGYSDIRNPNIAQEFLIQFLSTLGIPKERAKRYQDLYKEYFTPAGKVNWENPTDIKNVMQQTNNRKYGVMLQIFINPEIIDEVAYFAEAGGKKVLLPPGETPLSSLMKIRSQTEDGTLFNGNQIRLFLKPQYFHNPKYVKNFSYFSKHPEKSEKERREKLHKFATEDVAFLLSSDTPVATEPLLELQDRITGNVREQTDVSDQQIFEWFSANRTDAVRAYYDKNPLKVNIPLKNIHPISYGDDTLATPLKGYRPIQLSLMHKNQELFLYFLEKLDKETEKQFLSEKFPIQDGHMTTLVTPLEALSYKEFNLKVILPKLYEKVGDMLFEFLFLAENSSGIIKIMSTFNELGSIPFTYLENLFTKPSYLRGLQYIKTISLSEDQASLLANKALEDVWLTFKAMPIFTGKDLSAEDQRFYNILLKGAEKNYLPLATRFLMNKFIFSYFETVLKSIQLDQFSEEFARALFENELGDDFIAQSIKHFANLIKPHLPKAKKRYSWSPEPDPLLLLKMNYESRKQSSLSPEEKLIFSVYSSWLSKYMRS